MRDSEKGEDFTFSQGDVRHQQQRKYLLRYRQPQQ